MREKIYRLVILAIALALFAAVAVRFARRSPRTSSYPIVADPGARDPVDAGSATSSGAAPSASSTSVAAATGLTSNQSMTSRAPASAPAKVAKPPEPVGPPDEGAMLEIDQVNLMIRDYRTLTGENPVGTNAEIMAATMGENARQAKLGPPEGVKLNEKGELIDRWGTPYFFHQLSRDHMEIRSAGPDKVMWTADDPVIH